MKIIIKMESLDEWIEIKNVAKRMEVAIDFKYPVEIEDLE